MHWTKGGVIGQQEGILQDGLDINTEFLESMGLKPPPKINEYVVIANNKLRKLSVKNSIPLNMSGIELPFKNKVRILSVPIDNNGRAETLMKQIFRTWKQSLKLIK